jgi:hypothetical protein
MDREPGKGKGIVIEQNCSYGHRVSDKGNVEFQNRPVHMIIVLVIREGIVTEQNSAYGQRASGMDKM